MPPVAAGWKRDFLLTVDGWAKDQDANTAYSQAVEPLPFHGTIAYPYPAALEHFPTGILAKSVQDAGWFGFIAKLRYKAASAGRQLIEVDPRGTS